MAQSRSKQTLDVLQSMINGILIEVGRALRASDKEGRRSLTNANTRLKSFFPGAIDNFHQALDDLECDIVQAKAVFLRDMEELRAQRLALENPPIPVVEETTVQDSPIEEEPQETIMMEDKEPTPQPVIKEEKTGPQDAESELAKDIKPIETTNTSEDTKQNVLENSKSLQGPSPPSSDNKSNAVGLGIDTTTATDDPAPASAVLPDSSIDSLFDMLDSGNNDGSDIKLDSMDFLDSSNTQGQNDFDLSTFGNSQDFNMPDLQTTNDDTTANDNSANKQNDLFGLGSTSGGGEMTDLDLDLGTAGGDDSVFDDMFFGNTGEMEHGDHDNAFFGLD